MPFQMDGVRCTHSPRYQHIQQDFVRERQEDQSITSDDLIRRMTVAKYVDPCSLQRGRADLRSTFDIDSMLYRCTSQH